MASQSQSLQNMRDFVREAIDTDETDLPNSILDRFIIDGSNRVENFNDEWDFRAVTYTFDSEIGVQAYDIRDSLVQGIDMPLRKITDLVGPNWTLRPRPHGQMRTYYAGTSNNSGTPTTYSRWGAFLYLWPTPSAVETFTLTGYRGPIDWVNANSAPDFPDDLVELIEWWALSRAHAREGDPGMAAFYSQEFVLELRNRSSAYLGGLDAQPFAVNQDALGDDEMGDWRTARFGGPRFDWE